MKHRIFRFRSCYDTVACRIIIPDSQEHIALNPQAWPTDINVRRWQSPHQWAREKQIADGTYHNGWGGDRGYSSYNKDY